MGGGGAAAGQEGLLCDAPPRGGGRRGAGGAAGALGVEALHWRAQLRKGGGGHTRRRPGGAHLRPAGGGVAAGGAQTLGVGAATAAVAAVVIVTRHGEVGPRRTDVQGLGVRVVVRVQLRVGDLNARAQRVGVPLKFPQAIGGPGGGISVVVRRVT